jgi:small acid-soluble spore protein D (minor alpha/beta-type SASP)
MSRRNRNHYLVPEAKEAMKEFKGKVMGKEGYRVNPNEPDDVKFEIAKERNVPLTNGYNGNLTSSEAGTVGGPIGGKMVSEMIKLAKQNLLKG